MVPITNLIFKLRGIIILRSFPFFVLRQRRCRSREFTAAGSGGRWWKHKGHSGYRRFQATGGCIAGTRNLKHAPIVPGCYYLPGATIASSFHASLELGEDLTWDVQVHRRPDPGYLSPPACAVYISHGPLSRRVRARHIARPLAGPLRNSVLTRRARIRAETSGR